MTKYAYNVIIWDTDRQREVVVDRDGTRHDRREDGELMSRDEAAVLARRVSGTVVDGWDGDNDNA